MNVIRSRSMIGERARRAPSASMSCARIGTTPGSSTALSSPEMCASGAGMSTDVGAA